MYEDFDSWTIQSRRHWRDEISYLVPFDTEDNRQPEDIGIGRIGREATSSSSLIAVSRSLPSAPLWFRGNEKYVP
jgi:hypothetical protein